MTKSFNTCSQPARHGQRLRGPRINRKGDEGYCRCSRAWVPVWGFVSRKEPLSRGRHWSKCIIALALREVGVDGRIRAMQCPTIALACLLSSKATLNFCAPAHSLLPLPLHHTTHPKTKKSHYNAYRLIKYSLSTLRRETCLRPSVSCKVPLEDPQPWGSSSLVSSPSFQDSYDDINSFDCTKHSPSSSLSSSRS
ncbi:hypothetical protein EV356DRAFT_53805 [Viridothelium virens]|uniref:Uncharacterized protein n=1 Tax=Viridothelium virens TaxID=1048519 RepID=A0A6A6HG85_VIRVR|nr:hypothetical protein EV356DRAFT_53805 [Viridothelium virens]